jgi:hypothetical protein
MSPTHRLGSPTSKSTMRWSLTFSPPSLVNPRPQWPHPPILMLVLTKIGKKLLLKTFIDVKGIIKSSLSAWDLCALSTRTHTGQQPSEGDHSCDEARGQAAGQHILRKGTEKMSSQSMVCTFCTVLVVLLQDSLVPQAYYTIIILVIFNFFKSYFIVLPHHQFPCILLSNVSTLQPLKRGHLDNSATKTGSQWCPD